MEIGWLDHSCFLIKSSTGKKIIMDPCEHIETFEKHINNLDIVTISHNHFDHNNIENFNGKSHIINSCGTFNFENIKIQGIPSYHDKCEGIKRGSNIIFIIELDGFRICHLGDLGHRLNDETLNILGNIDILFIPVGGNFTLSGKEAAIVANSINSSIVIPMHYKTNKYPFLPEDSGSFIMSMKNIDKAKDSFLLIDKKLSCTNKVLILPHIK